MSDFLRIQNKTILISGGTSGIGKATCEMAIEYGARVIVIGRNITHLNQLRSRYEHRIVPVHLDLKEADFHQKLSQAIEKEEVHGFLHAAGISPTMPVNREKRKSWDNAMQINVYAGLEISQLLMKNHRSSLKSIVYVSSVMADLAEKAKGTYSMSKGALNAISRSQALEYSKFNVRVNTISPAVVNTPLTINSEYRKSEEGMRYILSKHPLGLGEPEDIANAALFLLSDVSRWITGSNLKIDGGYSIT